MFRSDVFYRSAFLSIQGLTPKVFRVTCVHVCSERLKGFEKRIELSLFECEEEHRGQAGGAQVKVKSSSNKGVA